MSLPITPGKRAHLVVLQVTGRLLSLIASDGANDRVLLALELRYQSKARLNWKKRESHSVSGALNIAFSLGGLDLSKVSIPALNERDMGELVGKQKIVIKVFGRQECAIRRGI